MINTSLDETLVKTTIKYSGKILNVYQDLVKLPNGNLTTREVVKHAGAVAVVPLMNDQVLMVRQFRQACGHTLFEIPAGTLKVGETPEQCARRELVEEIGYFPHDLKKIFQCYPAPGYSSEVIHIYLATELSKRSCEGDEDEFIEVIKIDLNTVLQMIQRNEIEDAKTISGILYLQQYLIKE